MTGEAYPKTMETRSLPILSTRAAARETATMAMLYVKNKDGWEEMKMGGLEEDT